MMKEYTDVDYTERARLILDEIRDGAYRGIRDEDLIACLSEHLRGERQEAEERMASQADPGRD